MGEASCHDPYCRHYLRASGRQAARVVGPLTPLMPALVFLLDQHQVVRPGEMGSVKYIDQIAQARGCQVRQVDLNQQFRSGGRRAYEYRVLRHLGQKPGGPIPWQPQDDDAYTLRVADSPNQTEAHLRVQSDAGYTARMTAGFC